MSLIKKREISRQFLVFIAVGGITTTLNYLSFLIFLLFLKLSPTESSVSGYLIGLGLGFYLNNRYTFRATHKSYFRTGSAYLGINAISIIAISILLPMLIHRGINVLLANILLLLLTTLFNFFGSKVVAFANREW